MASDFAIGQFQFLRSLLLVHGRYNYRRFAVFLYFSVYKNVVCQVRRWPTAHTPAHTRGSTRARVRSSLVAQAALFIWSMFAAASTELLLPSIFIDMLNPLAMTSLPTIVYPMFDQVTPRTNLRPGGRRQHARRTRNHAGRLSAASAAKLPPTRAAPTPPPLRRRPY